MRGARFTTTVERDVPVPMRDGVTLYADVYRPTAQGPFPVLVMRMPYEKETGLAGNYAHPSWYAARGYIVVIQDCRGRWRSEGEFTPFDNEGDDGFDTIAWATRLPGSSGRIGMYGSSYPGRVQLQAAITNPNALECISPAIAGTGMNQYEGGAFHLARSSYWAMFVSIDTARRAGRLDTQRALVAALANPDQWYRHLPFREFPPLRDAGCFPYFFDWLRHETYDDYWKARNLEQYYDRINVPGLHIGAWYDTFLEGTLQNYREISQRGGEGARGRQRMLIGPWAHFPWSRYTGDLDFGADAIGRRVDEMQLRFCDWLLRGEDDGISREPPIKLFVMGENVWRNEEEWPLRRAIETQYYLHSEGWAASLSGDGSLSTVPPTDEPQDTYIYDPRQPTASRGGHSCCWDSITPMGPRDQRPVERWMDTLCYTSEPLSQSVEVTGPVSVTLWAATDAPDTDWVARLVDVHPDGKAFNLTEGILRASFRDGPEKRTLLQRDEIYEYHIDLRATSNVFDRGHRIRVDVASASFPHWDANPNTGQPLGEATLADLRTATQTVFHDAARPSHITLSLVPRS